MQRQHALSWIEPETRKQASAGVKMTGGATIQDCKSEVPKNCQIPSNFYGKSGEEMGEKEER